jgi:hypothetical protein
MKPLAGWCGLVRVESILVEGLAHAFRIRIDNPSSCGSQAIS